MELAEFRRLDREFHSLIARACGNPLLVELYGKVLARLFRSEDFDELLSADANETEVERIVDDSTAHHADDRPGRGVGRRRCRPSPRAPATSTPSSRASSTASSDRAVPTRLRYGLTIRPARRTVPGTDHADPTVKGVVT